MTDFFLHLTKSEFIPFFSSFLSTFFGLFNKKNGGKLTTKLTSYLLVLFVCWMLFGLSLLEPKVIDINGWMNGNDRSLLFPSWQTVF